MKFRANMDNPQCMREFHNLVVTLSKLCKESVMNISERKIYFIANEDAGCTAPLIWVEIDSDVYFSEHKLESKYDQIMLCVSSSNLLRAFNFLSHTTQYLKMKLTRVQYPCLTIEAEVITPSSSHPRQVVHDIPVVVVPRADWEFYYLPSIPTCKIQFKIQSNRLMRNVIEKVKNLAPTITFQANTNGVLKLISETTMATITTRYDGLDVMAALNPREEDVTEACCSVDSKKAAMFISALQVPNQELSCAIDDNNAIYLEASVREGVAIHTMLPAVCF